jgi:peptidoglycan hydrolase-like protein with peptidoglycan-binding domain
VADPATSGAVPYLNWYRTIRHMRVGLDVLELEEVLRFLGLTYEADGIYGMTSVNAIKQFQLSQGVLHDGIVDEVTAQLLNRAVEAMIAGDADPQLDKALEVLGTIR